MRGTTDLDKDPPASELVAQAGALDREGRHEMAVVELLHRAAKAGNAAAAAVLGQRLLIRQGPRHTIPKPGFPF